MRFTHNTSRMIDPTIFANSLRESVGLWIKKMGEGLPPGRFRFCEKRCLVPVDGKRGQGVTCFAAKSVWNIGLWESWPSEVREGCIQFIKSFQVPDGDFVDQWLLRRIVCDTKIHLIKHGRFWELFTDMKEARIRAVRAETRQSASTLMLLGDQPTYRLPVTWQSESSVREFVRSLDWSHPWGAGSHASHLVAFVVMNSISSGLSSVESQMLKAAFEETDQFLDGRTGTWGMGDVTPTQRINGAMKMLTAYDWAGRFIPYPESLIDYVLSNTSVENGCGVLDRLFVLHKASVEVLGYRSDDLQNFALNALSEISRYYQNDGGFSFNLTHAQRSYYGAFVSLGGRQGDMHGTVMFTWACATALDLLGIRKELGWRISRP